MRMEDDDRARHERAAAGPRTDATKGTIDVVAREESGPILNGLPSQLPDIDPEETQEWLPPPPPPPPPPRPRPPPPPPPGPPPPPPRRRRGAVFRGGGPPPASRPGKTGPRPGRPEPAPRRP